MASRPQPPRELFDIETRVSFLPALDLAEWARDTFIDDGAPLLNVDHHHLQQATFGMLWTTAPNSRQMKTVVGTAEIAKPRAMMGKWPKARAEDQLIGWFGLIPDFLLTFSAPYAEQVDDLSFCSLIEHELYHCAQELDRFGQPKFSKEGRPYFGIRGHDAEEFVGVVRRYGVGAAAGGVRELVEAANRKPEIARVTVEGVCGTCMLRAA